MILLDTDVISHLLRPAAPTHLLQRLHSVPLRHRYLSAISVGEILHGIERTGRHEHIRMMLETRFLAKAETLPFDLAAARIYARFKAYLQRIGQPLDEPDLRIAAIAIANDLTLISGNEAHFQRVPGLKFENWLK